MPTPEMPRDLIRLIRAMQRDIDTVMRRSPFANTGFTATGPNSMALLRNNGVPALVFTDGPTTNGVQRISLTDSDGMDLFREDVNGQGAAWPLAPILFTGVSWPTWDSNTGTTFVAVAEGYSQKSSPRVTVTFMAICDSTAAGEVRLMCNGAHLGATATVPNLSLSRFTIGPIVVPGLMGDGLNLSLEARRVSGAGKIYARVVAAQQSASDGFTEPIVP